MKTEHIDIKDLLEKFSNLDDLEKHLAEKGHSFESLTKLKEFLYQAWVITNFNSIIGLLKEPVVQIDNLPYSEVRRNDTIFKVHGIIHGQFCIPLGPKVIEFVSSKVSSYRNPPEEDYLLEYGFTTIFNLDKSREIDCFGKVMDRVGQEKTWEMIGKDLESALSFNSIGNRYREIDNEIIKRIIQIYDNMLVDPNHLPIATKIYDLVSKIPEPFNLELKLKTGEKFNVYLSEEMARFMLNYVQQNKKLKLLHAVVGYGHESEICYFLREL